ncbi:MAG: endolytic transglycosylase MltG [Acidobacteriota bacterium]|nr:endolytic transglycosylase MltG [Acidobacteriota bacterium]
MWLAVGAVAALAALAAAAAGLVAWAEREVERPLGSGNVELAIERGAPLVSILDQLSAAGVIGDPLLARLYLDYRRPDDVLQAGEYRFEQPMSTVAALDRVIRGDVVTYPVTVIEGLTLQETAEHLASEGFGELDAFLAAMSLPGLIADLDPAAESLEGYLFPDTYAFPRDTGETEIVEAMVRNFRRRVEGHLDAAADHGLDPRGLVTLASIVEKEAGAIEERPLVSAVFHNRLDRGIGLYADPTIIYALKMAGTWDGNLRRRDLELDSPYNTYVHPGLPPGPICSPGEHSLRAAAEPADVSYLYFVSRNDGTHVFAETLAEHNRNVARWQVRYWRERR